MKQFSRRLAAVSAFCIGLGVTASSRQTLRPCSEQAALSTRWSEAWTTLGIAASRQPTSLGDAAAVRWFGSRNWFPVDGREHALCGRLLDWSLYDGSPFTKNELDIHPYIVPGEGFEYLFNDLPRNSRDGANRCNGQPCIYGELTASPPIREWLLGPEKGKAIEKKYVESGACAYGPWVMERVHQWLPEIHPMRAFWAAENQNSTERVVLLLSGDSSNRYIESGKFKQFGPANGKPWTARTVSEVVGVAYEVARGDRMTASLQPEKVFGKVSNGFSTYERSLDGASLAVSVPDWIGKGESEACTADVDGKRVVRGIEWFSVRVAPPPTASSHEAAGVALSVRRTGMTRQAPQDHLRRTALTTEVATLTPPPAVVLDMEVLDLAVRSGGSFDEPLRGTAEAWSLADLEHDDWRIHGLQQLTARVYFRGTNEEGHQIADKLNNEMGKGKGPHVTVRWTFEPEALDPAGTEVTVSHVNGPHRYGIATAGGDMIRTEAPELGKASRMSGSGESQWRTMLLITPPRRTTQPTAQTPLSPRLSIRAELRAESFSGEFTHVIQHYVPRFANVARNLEPPRDVLSAMMSAVRRGTTQFDSVTVAQMVEALSTDWKSSSATSAPQRRARIFRNAYLLAVRDGELAMGPWSDLENLAHSYADARWPR